MALPAGQISMSQVNTELSIPSTTTISLNQSNVRSLAGVPSGQISMSNLQGKSAVWARTISSPQQEMNLYTWATGQGYPGSGAAQITVGPGVYVWSDNTATAAMTIPSGFGAGNLTLINQGYIMGKGGKGGTAGAPSAPGYAAATAGGPAISVSQPVTINNTDASAYIGGGGGGGPSGVQAPAVGGAIGSIGGQGTYFPPPPSTLAAPQRGGGGGAGGGGGGHAQTGPKPPQAQAGMGGAGGRIFPGAGGAGGTAGGGAGGAGNASGTPANNPVYANFPGAGGGGWGAAGGNTTYLSRQGAAGGKAVTLNGNAITWTSGNTTRVYGAVS